MKKFKGLFICTDLDGTLLKKDKTISQENLNAIEYFKKEGGIFTFITGRMPFFAVDVYEKINPNAPFGCINGGGIYDHLKQKYLWTKEISKSVLTLVEYVDKNMPQTGIMVNTFEKVYFSKDNDAMCEFRKIINAPNYVCNYNDVKEPIAKIIFADKINENILKLKKLLDSHPAACDFDFIRSDKTLYEILPKGISKGFVLSKMVQLLGLDSNKTIAIGDYNNDISMLTTAKVGIAVSNAVPEVKAIADYITVSNEEHAIAKIIDDIDKGILPL